MNKQNLTKLALLVIVSLSFVLSACKPTDIVMTNTQLERDVQSYFCDPAKQIDLSCE